MKATLFTCVTIFLVSACSGGQAPSEKWSMAQKGVYSAAFDAQGQFALIASIHHGGSYWQIDGFERLYNWNHKEGELSNIVASAISADGRYAATAEQRKIALWNTQTGEPIWLWQAPADIETMKLSGDGQFALLGMRNYEAALFDIQNGGVKLRLPHEGIVQTVAITPDRRYAITGGDDSLVKVWDLSSTNPIYEWRLDNQVKVVAISDDGNWAFASSHRGDSIIWNISTGEEQARLNIGSGTFLAAQFNKDASLLLTGASSGQVHLWQVSDGKKLNTWKLSVENQWVTQNTQVEAVVFVNEGVRAIGANGSVYHFTLK